MNTDEIIITKFLDRNYKVTVGDNDFIVIDRETNYEYIYKDDKFYLTINLLFRNIIGDFKISETQTSINVFDNWFLTNKKILTQQLSEYFDNMNGILGSEILLDSVIKKFKLEYNEIFLTNYFNDYYNNKFLLPKINEYIDNINKYKTSKVIIAETSMITALETNYHKDVVINKINEWYRDTIITDKINDLLTQLVITLGKYNWQVTWIGHGPLNDNKIDEIFKNENEFQLRHITEIYDIWYQKEIVATSEYYMDKK